uniref:Uncharacterized protein n=1 Tax=Timema tahoe TaxID=61484 RepID=A0A7R9IJE5_9NEOP|nr:unnamed protein product [Timema tahoe]
MAYKSIIVAAVLAVANAGYLGSPAISYAAPAYASAAYAPAAITSQHSNILRTPGNLGQVSTYSKTIDTPYSSVSKSDVRVSNDALAYGAVSAYAPAIHGAYAAPAIHGAYAAPVVKTTTTAVSGHGLLGVAYSAAPVHSNILRTPGNLGQVSTYSKTIDTPYSSVSKSDVRVSNDALAYGAVPAYASYAAPAYHGAYAAPALAGHAYAAPALAARAYAAPAVAAHGGLLGVAYSAAPIHSNILRTPGNLGQVSTYSKTIDTPYSSVSKSDVRVSNDALAYGAVPAYASYAAPAYHGAYAAPALAGHAYAAPALAARAYAAPAVAAHGGLLGVAYSAAPIHSNILRTPGNLGQVSTYSKTIDTPYSSVSKSDVRVSNDALAYGAVPAYASYAAPAYHGAYAAPALAGHAYAAPALAARAYAAPAVAAHGGLLGVAYSAAPIVSHMTYSNAYGINYAY